MASITQNKKDGKIISYKFKVCVGRDEFGKQIWRCTTWKAAAEWERQVKDKYQKDLQNPERIKERQAAKDRTEFSDYILNTWFPICICDGEHKPTTVVFNKHIAFIFSSCFAHKNAPKKCLSFRVHIMQFLCYLFSSSSNVVR